MTAEARIEQQAERLMDYCLALSQHLNAGAYASAGLTAHSVGAGVAELLFSLSLLRQQGERVHLPSVDRATRKIIEEMRITREKCGLDPIAAK